MAAALVATCFWPDSCHSSDSLRPVHRELDQAMGYRSATLAEESRSSAGVAARVPHA